MTKLLFAAFFSVFGSIAYGQSNVATSAPCSPVITNPRSDVTITCSAAGLTKEQARRQAQEYAAILSRIRAQDLSFSEVIQKLDTIQKDVSDIAGKVKGRSVSDDQRRNFLALTAKAGKGPVTIMATSGDPEAIDYAEKLRKLLISAGYECKPVRTGTFVDLEGDPNFNLGIRLTITSSETLPHNIVNSANVIEITTTSRVWYGAQALKALQNSGLGLLSYAAGDKADADAVTVIVGHKPTQ